MSGKAQKITMFFPEFAGKTYDFILFQGSSPVVQKGTVPAGGRFVLEIPKIIEPVPYVGMARWMLTNTQEGGGLELIVAGADFSVECMVKTPGNKDIHYISNSQNIVLDSIYKLQKDIMDRYAVMNQAVKIFPKTDKDYKRYMKTREKQIAEFAGLREKLLARSDYASAFLMISNITNGVSFRLEEDEKMNLQKTTDYIAHQLNWSKLYTSGYWNDLIKIWVSLEMIEYHEGKSDVVKDFQTIAGKLTTVQYTSFVKRVIHDLTAVGKDDVIEKLRPAVVSSGKITQYEGVLSVFNKSGVGMQAPDLLIPASEIPGKDMKAVSFVTTHQYKYSLLLFYHTGCGHCDAVIKNLNESTDIMKQKNVRIISVAGDSDFSAFKKNAENFKWKDAYCDLNGSDGINFKNYGVAGTPTLILIDSEGKIVSRESSLAAILMKL